jgi:N-methylhydantoinase A
LRYEGQGYELRVSLEGISAPLDAPALAQVAERFHDLHTEIHGHAARDAVIEVVSYRLRASVPMPKAASGNAGAVDVTGEAKAIGKRSLTLGPGRVLDATIWRREQLAPGWAAQGPVIIEQPDATTIVPDGWNVRCDDHLNLVLERAA